MLRSCSPNGERSFSSYHMILIVIIISHDEENQKEKKESSTKESQKAGKHLLSQNPASLVPLD